MVQIMEELFLLAPSLQAAGAIFANGFNKL